MIDTRRVRTLDSRQSTQETDQSCVSLLSFGTALPPHSASQDQISEWMSSAFVDQPAVRRAVRSLHTHSGIERRHSCCPEYLKPVEHSRFTPGDACHSPSTAERMRIYASEAPRLGTQAARKALERYAAGSNTPIQTVTESISHLIVVSCTGFFAPGLDFVIARELGLSPTVGRLVIGFMGCSAAFNGMRTAHEIVRGQPDARVLVVCVELCSLHIQQSTLPAHLIAMSLFADGAAACLVGEATAGDAGVFRLDAFRTETHPDTEAEMVWEIGDHGFVLHLSPQIPEHVAAAAPTALHHLFGDQSPAFWAIHPGGRAIVDRLQNVFDLTPEQVTASRTILRRVGNLSSATILFVLEELRQSLTQEFVGRTHVPSLNGGVTPNGSTPQSVPGDLFSSGVAMAFGPGLVIEMARLTFLPVVSEG